MAVDNEMYKVEGDHWWGEDQPLHLLRTAIAPARLEYLDTVVVADGFDPAGQTVVDIGCGGGLFTEELARRGMHAIGVDPADASLQAARHHALQSGLDIDYRSGAGEHLPLEDASVDMAVCVDVLEHVEDIGVVLRETARVLRPGGLYLFDTLNRTPLSWLLGIKVAQDWPLTRFQPPHLHDWHHFVTPRELRVAASGAGLVVRGMKGMAPGGNPVGWLGPVRRLRKGTLSYGEFGRHVRFQLVDDLHMAYIGHAVKPAA
jgi:2-polyprenyl-6-hydroxyphenyl methylase / 3-demethylubiquinone-9 3-methyltransferase